MMIVKNYYLYKNNNKSYGNRDKYVIRIALFYVRSTVRHAIHLQFDIRANALEITAIQSPKCIV
jgi:hypothetical protein